MAADFKSHVLLRDEKGLFGIPFKRLLLAGVGGGIPASLVQITVSRKPTSRSGFLEFCRVQTRKRPAPGEAGRFRA